MTAKYEIVTATEQHALELAKNIREPDLKEVLAIGRTPDAVLARGVRKGAYTFLADDKVVCIFGLEMNTPFSRVAHPWLLSTHELENHRLFFARNSRKIVREWFRHFDALYNYVDSDYLKAIRWIKWLGFEINYAEEYHCPSGAIFYRFEMVKQ